ncbi:hypothetical protein Pan241w_52910 [Gimesia alba]|uniref:Uncharacterized protein n=1 Tax=Gimesia alba TaxID=2527973 RepID=A0A517RMY1_9PLAN|nr:hypothetical protein [Gimesia alba]QDT45172.1 hypothetical protein Pan241w_52910 [Gimesia alba]
MTVTVTKQPHQTTVTEFDDVQGRQQARKQGVEFYGGSFTKADEPHFCFVPLFMMSDKTDSKKPVQSFRLRGITASVFENQSEDGKTTFYKVTLQRSYKQGEEWKSTNSFGRDDLPIVSLLTKQAWEFILNTETNGQKENK